MKTIPHLTIIGMATAIALGGGIGAIALWSPPPAVASASSPIATKTWTPGTWETQAAAYIQTHQAAPAVRPQDKPGKPWRVQFGCPPERCFQTVDQLRHR